MMLQLRLFISFYLLDCTTTPKSSSIADRIAALKNSSTNTNAGSTPSSSSSSSSITSSSASSSSSIIVDDSNNNSNSNNNNSNSNNYNDNNNNITPKLSIADRIAAMKASAINTNAGSTPPPPPSSNKRHSIIKTTVSASTNVYIQSDKVDESNKSGTTVTVPAAAVAEASNDNITTPKISIADRIAAMKASPSSSTPPPS